MFYIGKHLRHRGLYIASRAALPAALLLFAAWLFISPFFLQVKAINMDIGGGHGSLEGLRIVYVTDIHCGNYPYSDPGSVDRLVTRINEQRPDLVLLGGDYAADTASAVTLFSRLSTIRSTYGIYAVMGEYDRTDDSLLNDLTSAMIRKGITPLVNQVISVRIGTEDICIAGIDDVKNGKPEISYTAMKCSSAPFVILLVHDPILLERSQLVSGADGLSNWYDLGIAGHTLGGSSVLSPGFLGRPVTESVYTYGRAAGNKAELLVSAGVGTVGLPVRLEHLAEIFLITLHAE